MSRRDYAQLFKLPISMMSTVSAATGFLAFTHAFSWRFLPLSLAILLLAFAACALNEAQEHELDALMERLHQQVGRRARTRAALGASGDAGRPARAVNAPRAPLRQPTAFLPDET